MNTTVNCFLKNLRKSSLTIIARFTVRLGKRRGTIIPLFLREGYRMSWRVPMRSQNPVLIPFRLSVYGKYQNRHNFEGDRDRAPVYGRTNSYECIRIRILLVVNICVSLKKIVKYQTQERQETQETQLVILPLGPGLARKG
jgi:hypothetical protein